MAFDKMGTLKLIEKLLSAPNTRWDKIAVEMVIDKIGLVPENKIISQFLGAMRTGQSADMGGVRFAQDIVRAKLRKDLQLTAEEKEFAMESLTSKELNLVLNSLDQTAKLEEIVDRKYKYVFKKATTRQQELINEIADISYIEDKEKSQLRLEAMDFLTIEEFENLTFEAKMEAYEELKDKYKENFQTKGKRKKYVRKNVIYNNDYDGEEQNDENKQENGTLGGEPEEFGIFHKLNKHYGDSWEEREWNEKLKEELKERLTEKYGFIKKDYKALHNEESGINDRYGDRDLYSAYNKGFKSKEVIGTKWDESNGNLKKILSDQSLTRGQRLGKIQLAQAKAFKQSPAQLFLKPKKQQNLGKVGLKSSKQVVQKYVKKKKSK